MTPTIAVIGLGNVGPPLVVEFGRPTRTIGVDLGADKVVKGGGFVDVKSAVDVAALAAAGMRFWRH